MKLIENWRACINHLWSIRVAIFAAMVGCVDTVLAAFQASLPPVVYSLLFVAIAVARVVQQKPLADPEATAPGVK